MAGRPSKLKPGLSEKIILLYEGGKTDAEVAEILGISVRTIHNWKIKYPELLHSIKEAKALADFEVKASLFRRAIGYHHPVEKVFLHNGRTIRAKTTKRYPPDTLACIYWLRNRCPGEWR